MVGNININYSAWANQKAYKLAKQADKDGVQGLQGQEITEFTREARANNIDKSEIYELMGLNISKTRAKSGSGAREKSEEFEKAIDFYNSKMDSRERYDVTRKTNDNMTAILGKMEQDINKAYIDCDAFKDPDIMTVLASPYRYYYYPRFIDRLQHFDIDEIRTRTTKDMESLNQIKDKIEYIMEEANGETKHNKPQKTEYDVDAIAKRYLGMSYEEFAAKYPAELEKCKYITAAEVRYLNETEAYVYDRAKAYAAEMLEITIQEAHTTHWDIQERKLYESLDAAGDTYVISEFEYDGITDEGLSDIKSGITYRAFEDALIDKYNELKPTAISTEKAGEKPKNPVKCA